MCQGTGQQYMMTTSVISNDIIPFNVSMSDSNNSNVKLTRVRPLLLNDSAGLCDISSLHELDVTTFEPVKNKVKRVSFVRTKSSLSQKRPIDNPVTTVQGEGTDSNHVCKIIDNVPNTVSTFKKDDKTRPKRKMIIQQ